MSCSDRFRGCLLGLAVGDAVGTAVEFQPRGSFAPVTDMVGGGVFELEPGQWTDDTSMALCLATSLVEKDGFDARDQMERYCRWWRDGYLSSTGSCFDIGGATRQALARFEDDSEPFAGSTDEHSAGNGSLMRLAPVPMFYHQDMERAGRYAADSSRCTHAAAECIDACRLFARMIAWALAGDDKSKGSVLLVDQHHFEGSPAIAAIARGEYRSKSEREIVGSGYVVRSLEAALWCFDQSESFEEAVLRAANLGDDADTTAAICGQIAGAFWGVRSIPSRWLERLAMRAEIEGLAERLMSGFEQRCPICGEAVMVSPRYPAYVCSSCQELAVDPAGRSLRFYNVDHRGGVRAVVADTGEPYDEHWCLIQGRCCTVDEARFGGIVVQIDEGGGD